MDILCVNAHKRVDPFLQPFVTIVGIFLRDFWRFLQRLKPTSNYPVLLAQTAGLGA